MAKIGWIGAGMVGTQMVLRLIHAGHQVIVCVRKGAHPALTAAGARITIDAAEAAAAGEYLGLCVFSDEQIVDLANVGVIAAMRADAVLLNHTTGAPALFEHLGDTAPHVALLDVAFSGSASEAANGEIAILAGGDATTLAKASPILCCYANRIFHLGALGAGRRLKLLNNALYAANLSLAVQAHALAETLGLSPDQTLQALDACSAGSWAMRRLARAGAIPDLLDTALPYLRKDLAALRGEGVELGGIGVAADSLIGPH